MAEKIFSVPSLVSKTTWQIAPGGTKARWDDLFKQWKDDHLLGSWSTQSIVLDQEVTFTDRLGNIRVLLARNVSHLDKAGATPLAQFSRWEPWQGITPDTSKIFSTGVFLNSRTQTQWLLLLPGGTSLDPSDSFPFMHPVGLAPSYAVQDRPWTARPVALFHELEDQVNPVKPWYAFSRTMFLQGPTPDSLHPVFSPNLGFDALNLALRETRGTAFAGRPFHGLVPSFEAVDDFDPLIITALVDRSQGSVRAWATRLVCIHLGKDARHKTLQANIDWFYPFRDQDDVRPATGFSLRGTFDESYAQEQFTQSWSDVAKTLADSFSAILSAKRRDGPLVEFKLRKCAPVGKPSWIRLGSLEIQPYTPPAAAVGDGCTLKFSVAGTISSGATAVYPDTDLEGLCCRVRFAAGADPVAQSASLDSDSTEFENQRRETDPIVFLRDMPERSGILRMQTRYEGSRDATTQITVVVDTQGGAASGSAFWLNLRPFMAAKLQFDKDEDAHTTLVWRSDDPQGPQWRVEHDTVRVILPPQAVGEEMERGDRFYKDPSKPDIGAGGPIRYRFSRPTYLTLRPSDAAQNRRFDRSPLNLRELMRGAQLERMVVEMAYPLEVTYERTKESTRQLRLVEAGEFFGHPAPTLTGVDRDPGASIDQPGQLRGFAQALPDGETGAYTAKIKVLMRRQRTVQQNFVSRLAELHLHDPARAHGDLALVEDVKFRMRDTRFGAQPLHSPLPRSASFKPGNVPQGGDFHHFLTNGAWADSSIRAGLVHSFEFPSELIEVLDTAEAVAGVVEALTLSALGATGRMEASFASGKTSFAVVVAHGQLSRLVKTRIGRIGALWNRAKHVIVYERTAARSAQLKDEQSMTTPFDGWPILRKTEEYIEPIQVERKFSEEPGMKAATSGFIDSSIFETRRIYVNGAWARNLVNGYELPLWDRHASEVDSRFYPKPKIFLQCHGEADRMTRLWFREPDRLFFYTTTAKGTDAVTDAWPPCLNVDYDNLPAWPILEPVPDKDTTRRTPADPAICTSPRFDLAVDAEGPVDLQYGRGTTPMLVMLKRVSVSRSAKPSPDRATLGTAAFKGVQDALSSAQKFQSASACLAPTLESLRAELVDAIGKQLYAGKPRTDISVALENAIKDAAHQLRDRLDPLPSAGGDLLALVKRSPELWKAQAKAWTDSLWLRANLPADVVDARVKQLAAELESFRDSLPTGPLTKELNDLRAIQNAALRSFGADLSTRLQTQLKGPVEAAVASMQAMQQGLQRAETELAEGGGTLLDACTKALAQLVQATAAIDKLPREVQGLSEPVGNWLRKASTQVQSVAASLGFINGVAAHLLTSIRTGLHDIVAGVGQLGDALKRWIDSEIGAAESAAMSATDAIWNDFERQAGLLDVAQDAGQLRDACDAMLHFLRVGDNTLGARYSKEMNQLKDSFKDAASMASDIFVKPGANALENVTNAIAAFAVTTGKVAAGLEQTLLDLVNAGTHSCQDLQRQLEGALANARDWVEGEAKTAIGTVLSSEAARQIEAYAAAMGPSDAFKSSALALARVVGDLPSVTPLKFDIDIAAYVFDGVKPGIQMTPAVARLAQDGEKLLESLGLSLPCSSLLDQLVPDSLAGMDFSTIFNKFAGINFSGLFSNFKLPDLGADNVKITHGFDPGSRRAWVNAQVAFAKAAHEELFALGPVALGLENMGFTAFSGVETTLIDNQPQLPTARTSASLLADWILEGAGQMLVRFNKVAIKYDGASGFDFAVSPDDIELNPALKFVSEFIEQFQGNLPPAIKIIEEHGRPVGVSAGTTIVLDDLPDLGAVIIGPIDMRSSLELRLDQGRFVIGSAFSLGNKQAPIFVQITWLGGGCWLEARAKYVDGTVKRSMSIGLSVGSTRSFNFASVAQGSYNVQLFCYIEISDSGDDVAIGLSVTGSALIIGFVNANVSLLLEAHHSGGAMQGTGRLDVEVKISWVYTFRFKQSVAHSF